MTKKNRIEFRVSCIIFRNMGDWEDRKDVLNQGTSLMQVK